MFDAQSFLRTLPEMPGVYRMLAKDGAVLYVGKAKQLKKRVASYFRKNLANPRLAMMVRQIADMEVTVTRSEAEALLLENNLIKRLCPRYNILVRDDKSYPYIVIGREDFPRLGFFRGMPNCGADYFGPYPSASAVREGLYFLQKTFRLRSCEDSVFAHRSRPCLLYQIQRCSGPCVRGLVTREEYARDVQHAIWFLQGRQNEVFARLRHFMEEAAARLEFEAAAFYRNQLQTLRRVQEKQFIESQKREDLDVIAVCAESGQLCVNLAMVRGGRHLGDHHLFADGVSPQEGDAACSAAEAMAAFISQHYARHPAPARLLVSPLPEAMEEVAAALEAVSGREVPIQTAKGVTHKAWVDMATQNARLAINARNQDSARQRARLVALQEALGLVETPARIECFDISHTQGESPVASCVAYQDNGMKNADYRRFNIRDVTPGDDYAAIRQAVTRRYARLVKGEGRAPDLVLIDGGKGQAAVAAAALAEMGLPHLPVVGVAKGEGRKTGLESLVFPDGRALQLQSVTGIADAPLSPALALVVEIRDEAHRFALVGHRARRGKARDRSRLNDIPGVGPMRRKALLARFGGLSGVVAATEEQLVQTPGISPALAKAIYRALH
ncbi:MAG: excinuclease ABC subunit UvrC [Zoogloeaceae bacterium]|jgi:excinuclease ABC subunit C|nr:excinuclease ABC subunit UvrC [Zoogloeaceae bacterium]